MTEELLHSLRPFAHRARLARGFKWSAYGGFVGGAAGCALASLDWFGVLFTSPAVIGVVFGAMLVLGFCLGLAWPLDTLDLAHSVDRRAGLKDRTSSALELSKRNGPFSKPMLRDSIDGLKQVRPGEVFRPKLGRWHLAATVLGASAVGIFMLGNSPLVRGKVDGTERKELQEAGQTVQHIARPVEKLAAEGGTASEKRLANELGRFSEELKRGRLDRSEAMRKADAAAKAAEAAAKDRAKAAEKELTKAKTALGKLQAMQLDKSDIDPKTLEELGLTEAEAAEIEKLKSAAGVNSKPTAEETSKFDKLGVDQAAKELLSLSETDRQKLKDEIAKRQQEIQDQIDKMDAMPESERQRLQQESAQNEKLLEALEASQKIAEQMKQLAESPEARELAKMLEQMESATETQQNGGELTEEQMKQLEQGVQKLQESMKGNESGEQAAQAMNQAMKQLKSGQTSLKAMRQMLDAMQMQRPSPSGESVFADTGKVVKSKEDMKTPGKTNNRGVKGEWQGEGDEFGFEIKAPATLGGKSSVPYRELLPKYRKAAEGAIGRNKIPKEHERRVREYFDSLSGGK